MPRYHNSRIETRVPEDIKESFSEMAHTRKLTASELTRHLIVQYVQGRIKLLPIGFEEEASSTANTSEAS